MKNRHDRIRKDSSTYKFVHADDPIVYDQMLSRGVVPHCEVVDDYQSSALRYVSASSRDKYSVAALMAYLLSYGLKYPDSKHGVNGNTAMHFAACNNNLTALKLLIDFGCDRSALNAMNQTPMDVCKHCDSREVGSVLQNYFPSTK